MTSPFRQPRARAHISGYGKLRNRRPRCTGGRQQLAPIGPTAHFRGGGRGHELVVCSDLPTASEGATTFVESMAKQQGVSLAEVEKRFFVSARPTSLLKRFETPEEVAVVVALVASTHSVAINGAPVRAEAGVVQSIL